jgi:hypothetical protein
MTITAGTGNSRTLSLQSTTSGGTATTFLTGRADQSMLGAQGLILQGTVGALSTAARTDATIELQSVAFPCLSLFMTRNPNLGLAGGDEGGIPFSGYDAAGNLKKIASISGAFSTTTAGSARGVFRINATTNGNDSVVALFYPDGVAFPLGGVMVGSGTLDTGYAFGVINAGSVVSGNFYSVAKMGSSTKGLLVGFDNSLQLGTIGSQGANSGLSFWTHNGNWGERYRIGTDGNSAITGSLTTTTTGQFGATTGGGGLTVISTAENRLALKCYTDDAVDILFQSHTQTTGHYNWIIGSQIVTNQAFEIVPSTAINGTTFTTPALRIAGATGIVTMPSYGAGAATFDSSGNISSVSDRRLKENIVPFARGLAAVLALKPVTFHWTKASGLTPEDLNVGFIAQDVQIAIPEAVGTERTVPVMDSLTKQQTGTKRVPSDFLSLSDRAITASLVNAVRELAAQNAALTARVAILEKK